ncbi:protein S40-5-like [Magnolia sinica]|uniref:protein S40-5-like n=1 Tax=Magnolia sinica TaxID=86752 RepID=UPI00265A6D32|nr:protein S40-5-like [Magnolia sinica]
MCSCPIIWTCFDHRIMIKVSTIRVAMAKGRKFGLSHHDRLLGSHGYNQDQPNGADHSELAEEDVWSIVNDGIDHEHAMQTAGSSRQYEMRGDPMVRNRRWAAATGDRHVGGLSLAFEDTGKTSSRIVHQFSGPDASMLSSRGNHMAASAPVNVPDWSKILRVDSVESLQEGYEMMSEEDEWVPPHEYLAQSRRSAAHSVFEGVGRTLKGRDMSRVRNAVWSRTGFLG